MNHTHNAQEPATDELLHAVDQDTPIPQKTEEEILAQLPVVPDVPPPVFDYRDDIAYFCFSLQGSSHAQSGKPCQDRCHSAYVEPGGYLITAIADGVGSCALSDLGAHVAVHASVDYLREHLTAQKGMKPGVKEMGELLRKTMQFAYDAVEKTADDAGQLVYSLQSTLTVSVYNGSDLFFAHAGDDGIVALNADGCLQLATVRHKGEEASSVYPLQNTATWQYGMFRDTVAYVMATDGILDCFVSTAYENNRVYYPFIQNAISARAASARDTMDICHSMLAQLQQPEFRRSVTDDLTIAVVTNQKKVHASLPAFDQEAWDADSKRYQEARYQALYGKPEPPVHGPADGADSTGGIAQGRPDDDGRTTASAPTAPSVQQPNPAANGSPGPVSVPNTALAANPGPAAQNLYFIDYLKHFLRELKRKLGSAANRKPKRSQKARQGIPDFGTAGNTVSVPGGGPVQKQHHEMRGCCVFLLAFLGGLAFLALCVFLIYRIVVGRLIWNILELLFDLIFH